MVYGLADSWLDFVDWLFAVRVERGVVFNFVVFCVSLVFAVMTYAGFINSASMFEAVVLMNFLLFDFIIALYVLLNTLEGYFQLGGVLMLVGLAFNAQWLSYAGFFGVVLFSVFHLAKIALEIRAFQDASPKNRKRGRR